MADFLKQLDDEDNAVLSAHLALPKYDIVTADQILAKFNFE